MVESNKEGMKHVKKWLLIIIALSLVLIAPAVGKRHQVEWDNRTYEMIMPYDEIEAWLQEEKEEDVWKQLKEAGLTTVSVEAETLESLGKSGRVLLIEMSEFKRMLIFANENVAHLPSRGLVVYPLDETFPLVSSLEAMFGDDVQATQANGKTYYIIEGNAKKIKRVPLGYDEMKIAHLIEQGLMVVLRIPDARDMNEASVHVLQQIEALKNEHTSKLLPTGEEVAGYPTDVTKWGKSGKKQDMLYCQQSFTKRKG